MASIWPHLAGIFQHHYQPSKKHGRYIWGIQVAHDGKPLGAGELFTDPEELAQRIQAATQHGGTLHLCTCALTGYEGDPHRKVLDPDFAGFVVLDIDAKDQDCDITELETRISSITPIPTLIANSANGLHVYYHFDENMVAQKPAIHRRLQRHYKSQNVIVDPGHSSNKSTIRALGALGKGGGMIVGDNFKQGGPVYQLDSFAAALSVPAFDIEVRPSSGNFDTHGFSLHPQAPRHALLTTCAAMAQFVKDSESDFQSGSVSNYHDARMFASQASHSYDDDAENPADLAERQEYATDVLLRWPTNYLATTVDFFEHTLATPALRCDKWGTERYQSVCEVCKYRGSMSDSSPIQNTISDLLIEQAQPSEASTPTPTTTQVSAPTNKAAPVVPILPEGYVVGKDGLLFRMKPPAADDVNEDGTPKQPKAIPVLESP